MYGEKMVDYRQFMVFDIEDSGDKNRERRVKLLFKSRKAIINWREDLRRIYLWKGAKSSIIFIRFLKELLVYQWGECSRHMEESLVVQ